MSRTERFKKALRARIPAAAGIGLGLGLLAGILWALADTFSDDADAPPRVCDACRDLPKPEGAAMVLREGVNHNPNCPDLKVQNAAG